MAFHEIQFPTAISRGARASSIHRHSILELQSGAMATISRWPSALWAFEVAFGSSGFRTFADLQLAYDFWLRRDGQSNGFRFHNPFEHSTASDHRGAADDEDEQLGVGDGSTKTFQLIKTYTDAIGTTTRTITKPKAGTVVVAVDGVAQVSPTWTDPWTVDTSSGVITFTTAPTGGGTPEVITAGCEFDLPVQFGPRMSELSFQLHSEAAETGRAPSIQLMEMAGDVVTPEMPYRGGQSTQSFSADLVYDFSMGATVVLNPSTSGLNLILPTISDLPDGGPHLNLINIGSDSVACLNRSDNSTEFTVAASTAALAFVTTESGTKTWRAAKGTT